MNQLVEKDETGVYKVANWVNIGGKEIFSSTFMPKHLETSIILLHTHTHIYI